MKKVFILKLFGLTQVYSTEDNTYRAAALFLWQTQDWMKDSGIGGGCRLQYIEAMNRENYREAIRVWNNCLIHLVGLEHGQHYIVRVKEHMIDVPFS